VSTPNSHHRPAPLSELVEPDEFTRRHVGPSPDDIAQMLSTISMSSTDELLDATMPASIVAGGPLALPGGVSERDALRRLRTIAAKNHQVTSLIGMGYTGTITPPVIARNVLENPAWYTAYTPYQPEISQGRLEALLNFQTLITELTGLDVANASLLDEATAAAEAMAMCQRLSKSKATAFFVDHHALPQTIAVIRTRAAPMGWEVIVGDPCTELDPAKVFGYWSRAPKTWSVNW